MTGRNVFVFFFCLLVAMAFLPASDETAFLGKWDIMPSAPPRGSQYAYWLEVKQENGVLSGNFLNRGGSVLPLAEISIVNGELVFTPAGNRGPDAPKPVHRARVVDGKLVGTLTMGTQTQTSPWVGVRPPKWGHHNANAKHGFGKPIELFDGKAMDNWGLQFPDRPSGWSVDDGVMTNSDHANNIVSKEQFKDFKIRVEYKLQEKSSASAAPANSGIYLRGRYELQVLDDAGKAPESHGHMAIYSRVAPRVNASKPAGEWQTMEATIVGNRVTVVLNGQTVHGNAVIDGITGGALNSYEAEAGPIMIQGDHGKIWVRSVTVTPVKKEKH
ncbi:MAG: 3-keto-disaccharide hydrolase [Acidobacteriota bacterium]